jgi:hypothetical protein
MRAGVGCCSRPRIEFVWEENELEGRDLDEDGRSAMFGLANSPLQLSKTWSTTGDLQKIASLLEVLVLSIPMSIKDRTWFRSRGLRVSNHLGLTRAQSEGTVWFRLLRAILVKLTEVRQYRDLQVVGKSYMRRRER